MIEWPTAIVLDCGETLFDETRQWSTWARWLGVTPFSLMVALGAVLQRNEPFTNVFKLFDPNFEIDCEIDRRRAEGSSLAISEQDLHTDVRPALAALSEAGWPLVIAGTMTEAEQAEIAALELPVRAILSGRELGNHTNRQPGFFDALVARLEVAGPDLLYVSHRYDTAGAAAAEAGTTFGYLRRGRSR